ncbi:MAG: glycine dehydrogenase, partial [Elusimicrobiales bacterium]|nr:glycine dehydrogenase [Elusimicrobiales bacterium]
LRQMPGRICGMTVDKDGKRGFTLTLQAREQHIRREKAPSNICSNQALCALSVTIYLTLLGKEGLKELALLNHNLAVYASKKLFEAGIKTKYDKPFFNEFAFDVENAESLRKNIACSKKIDIGITASELGEEFKNTVISAFTETKNEKEIDLYVSAIKEYSKSPAMKK